MYSYDRETVGKNLKLGHPNTADVWGPLTNTLDPYLASYQLNWFIRKEEGKMQKGKTVVTKNFLSQPKTDVSSHISVE